MEVKDKAFPEETVPGAPRKGIHSPTMIFSESELDKKTMDVETYEGLWAENANRGERRS